MKSIALIALSLLALTGCASRYDITTLDGQHYVTRSTPDFTMGRYKLEDTEGVKLTISLFNVKSVSRQ